MSTSGSRLPRLNRRRLTTLVVAVALLLIAVLRVVWSAYMGISYGYLDWWLVVVAVLAPLALLAPVLAIALTPFRICSIARSPEDLAAAIAASDNTWVRNQLAFVQYQIAKASINPSSGGLTPFDAFWVAKPLRSWQFVTRRETNLNTRGVFALSGWTLAIGFSLGSDALESLYLGLSLDGTVMSGVVVPLYLVAAAVAWFVMAVRMQRRGVASLEAGILAEVHAAALLPADESIARLMEVAAREQELVAQGRLPSRGADLDRGECLPNGIRRQEALLCVASFVAGIAVGAAFTWGLNQL